MFLKSLNKLIRETCQFNWQLFPALKVRLVNSFLDENCSAKSISFPFCNNIPTKNISNIDKFVRKNAISFSSLVVVFWDIFIKMSLKIKLICKVLSQHWQRFSWIWLNEVLKFLALQVVKVVKNSVKLVKKVVNPNLSNLTNLSIPNQTQTLIPLLSPECIQACFRYSKIQNCMSRWRMSVTFWAEGMGYRLWGSYKSPPKAAEIFVGVSRKSELMSRLSPVLSRWSWDALRSEGVLSTRQMVTFKLQVRAILEWFPRSCRILKKNTAFFERIAGAPYHRQRWSQLTGGVPETVESSYPWP